MPLNKKKKKKKPKPYVDLFSTTPKITTPLNTLLQKYVEWSFDQLQQKAIDNLKDLLKKQPLLQFYNPSLPTKIFSRLGLGAILEQKSMRS